MDSKLHVFNSLKSNTTSRFWQSHALLLRAFPKEEAACWGRLEADTLSSSGSPIGHFALFPPGFGSQFARKSAAGGGRGVFTQIAGPHFQCSRLRQNSDHYRGEELEYSLPA